MTRKQTKALIFAALAEVKPPEKLTISQWADKYRILSPEASAESGKWRTDRAIYQRGLMDACNDPKVKQIVVMSSAQVGKTEVVLNVLGYFLHYEPCPILVVNPTLQMAETFSKDRLAPMLRDCGCFKGLVKDPKSKGSGNTLLHKQMLNSARVTMAGANSAASLASRPIRAVLCDEIDRYPISAGEEGDPINLALKRTTTFWNSISILVSTPTVKGISRIEKAYEASDRRRYMVACPHCNKGQPLRWENVHYSGKGTDSYDLSDLLYFCEGCGAGISETEKAEMLRRGYWEAERASQGIAGFHLNELYSPWKSWRDVAMEYEAARNDPQQFRVWYNTSLGLPLEEDNREAGSWESLLPRVQDADYSLSQVPEGALLLTAGVDVQADRLECAVFGWGEGEQSWLVNYQVFLGDPQEDDVWEALQEFLGLDYPHPLGKSIRVKLTAVDTGFLAPDVYAQILRRRSWVAVKGRAGDRPLVGSPSLQEVNLKGKKIKKGIKLYLLGVDQAKSVLLGRAKIQAPGPRYLGLPADVSEDWMKGFIQSEVRVKKFRGGLPYYTWEPISGQRNEPLDTAVYAYCAAVLAGMARTNWEKLKRLQTIDPIEETPPPEPTPEPEPKPRQKRRSPGRTTGQNWAKGW